MNCETVQERLTARLTGELDPAEVPGLEAHLESCADCAAEARAFAEVWRELAEPAGGIPTARMRQRLDTLLASELANVAPLPFAERTRSARRAAPAGAWSGLERHLLPLAAMLLLGLGLGYFAFGHRDADLASSQSLQSLQREVGDLHEMVALSLLERGSVSERLQGVSYGREISAGEAQVGGAPNAENGRIVEALFARLIEDPNVNVRLAALEALRPSAERPSHRGQLVAAVARQSSPLVALSLIDLLLESGTDAARHDLEQLLANDQLEPVVRGYLRDRLGRSA